MNAGTPSKINRSAYTSMTSIAGRPVYADSDTS
jgi:hypothetical protein